MATGSSKKTGDRQGSKDAQGQKNPPTPPPAPATPEEKGALQKLLDGVEKAGNKAPHPVLMFFHRLSVPAQTAFAAYRVGDSPINVMQPLLEVLNFHETREAPLEQAQFQAPFSECTENNQCSTESRERLFS